MREKKKKKRDKKTECRLIVKRWNKLARSFVLHEHISSIKD